MRTTFLPRIVRRLSLALFVSAAALSLALAQPKTLTILHTNDMHAAFVPHEAYWVRTSPKPMVGGFKELSFEVDSLRKADAPAILLDAGDVMTGNPITERKYDGAYGGALFAMMNMIGYDAWCLGNHDFDISQDNLRRLTAIADFPTLSANVVDDKGDYPVGNKPYIIIERGGLRIGIIGVMSQDLYGLVNQNNLTGIRVLSPVETTQKLVNELRPKTDLLIALTHEGVDDDSVLAEKVEGLDIIVGGHSHTRLKKPKRVHGVIIVQTGANCENLGVLKVTVDDHRVIKESGSLIPLWARQDRPKTRLTVLVDSMEAVIKKDYSQVIATLRGDWRRKEGPSPIGDFIAEAQRAAAHADVAFMNNHGIRRDLLSGPITKQDLFEVLPFRNVLVTFQLSGAQLRSVMRYDLENHPGIQVAGIDCDWSRDPGGTVEFKSINVQGMPLDDGRTYVCAASDFFVGEARKYLGLEIPSPIFLKQTVFEAVEDALRREGTVTPSMKYRLQREQ